MSANEPHRVWPADALALRLGDLHVDLRFRKLRHQGGESELPQRCFELFLLLLAEPERVHSRAELLERIWAGVIVEDANLSQAVWTLRRALGRERRDWIRTVAKSGYVFQPGIAPVADAEPRSAVPAPAAPTEAAASSPDPEPATETAPLPTQAQRAPALAGKPLRWAAVAAIALLLVLGVFAWPRLRNPAPPLLVGLVEISDPSATPAERWPATLLRAWCEWKLAALPGVLLLPRDRLATGATDSGPLRTVLVSSSTLADGRIVVQLRLDGSDGPPLRAQETPQDLVAALDALSDALLARLLPGQAMPAWPALELDADGAAAYAEFAGLRERLQWSAAAKAGRAAAQRAPGFGLVHLQLAQVLAQLGQMREAREHALAAERLLKPLPADAASLLVAQLAGIRREAPANTPRQAVASARTPLLLEQARALLGAQRGADAQALLAGEDWSSQPPALRIAALLLGAQASLQAADAETAARQAQAAATLAQARGWRLEEGLAQMQLAAAERTRHRDGGDAAGFERAAALFAEAGDPLRALQAQLLALDARSEDPDALAPLLDTLLAQARAAGHRGLEIDALQLAAFAFFRAGDMQGYRARLGEAAGVAAAAGDTQALARMDLYLLPLALDAGDYAEAQDRLERLATLPLQGEGGFWVAHFARTLRWRRGEFAALGDELERSAGHAPSARETAPLLDYVRAQLRLTRGDPAGARSAFAACADSPAAVFRVLGRIGGARVDLYVGDQTAARAQLVELPAAIGAVGSGNDRAGLLLEYADLALRAGLPEGARSALDGLLPALQANGQRVLEAEARIRLARLALAMGDWPELRAQAEAAQALAPAEDWLLAAPLRQLHALTDLRRGERERAAETLAQLEGEADRRGDRVVQAEVHALFADLLLDANCCAPAARQLLLAHSGLRGVRWALPPLIAATPARAP